MKRVFEKAVNGKNLSKGEYRGAEARKERKVLFKTHENCFICMHCRWAVVEPPTHPYAADVGTADVGDVDEAAGVGAIKADKGSK